ncbi:MAG: 30S ribosomal protein S20 [Bacillota bacterium]|nr:30S ribosomal protein S20 [Bacillota bacterium]
MPNIKSAKKRVKVTEVKTLSNQVVKNTLKTYIKKFETATAAGDKNEATKVYLEAVVKVDKAASQGILHKNTAARKKSYMTNLLNAM